MASAIRAGPPCSCTCRWPAATAFHRRHRRSRRSRQERARQGADGHRSRPPAGREVARNHDRPRLCPPGASRARPRVLDVSPGDRRRARSRGFRQEHGRRRRLDRSRALVVAADDGWMPQTEEHLQILTYFGVRRAVVALTKADLAADEHGVGRTPSVSGWPGRPFADAPIVPTSVVERARLDRSEGHAGARAGRDASTARYRQAAAPGRPRVHACRASGPSSPARCSAARCAAASRW